MKSSILSFEEIFPQNLYNIRFNDYSDVFSNINEKLERIATSVGKKSNGFKLRKEEIAKVAPDISRMKKVVNSAKYIRPLLALWNEMPFGTLKSKIPLTKELIAHIDLIATDSRRGRLGRLALKELCNLFFRGYDNLDCINEIARCIEKHLDKYQKEESICGLNNLRINIKDIISPNGHKYIAQTALEHSRNLAEVALFYDIPIHNSRFYEKSLLFHYLARLKQVAANEEHQILKEITLPEVYDIKIGEKYRLGHQAIAWLIDTLVQNRTEPSQFWRNVILGIAGDPRLPPSSSSYSHWWAPLDSLRPEKHYAQTMRSWLSRVDLELFLQIMKQYAKELGGEAIRRMYPEREKFLKGLFSKKIVKETRLFLGTKTANYLQKNINAEDIPYFIKINGVGEMAIFYLNLGNAHMVEGTHNICIRLLDRLPRDSFLYSSSNMVDHRFLRKKLIEDYKKEFGQNGAHCYEVVHRAGWQSTVVACLQKMNVDIQLKDVVDEDLFFENY